MGYLSLEHQFVEAGGQQGLWEAHTPGEARPCWEVRGAAGGEKGALSAGAGGGVSGLGPRGLGKTRQRTDGLSGGTSSGRQVGSAEGWLGRTGRGACWPRTWLWFTLQRAVRSRPWDAQPERRTQDEACSWEAWWLSCGDRADTGVQGLAAESVGPAHGLEVGGGWGEREGTGEPGLAESVGHGAVNCCWESVRGVWGVCVCVYACVCACVCVCVHAGWTIS